MAMQVFYQAKVVFAGIPAMLKRVTEIEQVLSHLQKMHTNIDFFIDLLDLRGYQYHTGLVFSAHTLVGDRVIDLAKGGRYDGVGEAFGRSRPATGFSADLVQWVLVTLMETMPASRAILAPCVKLSGAITEAEKQLQEKIAALRAAGESVIVALPESPETAVTAETFDRSLRKTCDRQLVWQEGVWQVLDLR
jgi:ATP phosphoribosyltransferase regulatory subunit